MSNTPEKPKNDAEAGEKRKRGQGLMDDPQNQTIGAVVLIALGVIFLLKQLHILPLSFNWWALLILVPGGVLLYRAYDEYRLAGGVLTKSAREHGIGGTVLVLVAAVFLLNINWGVVWPAFLIIAGVAMWLNINRQ
jgi:hypothetical protein